MVRRGKWNEQKKKRKNSWTQTTVWGVPGGGVESGGGGYREGVNGDGGDLARGGEHTHTVRCTDHVLRKCAPETCVILLTNVTPINSNKKRTLLITLDSPG